MRFLFVSAGINPGTIEFTTETLEDAGVKFKNFVEDWRANTGIVETFYLCKIVIREERNDKS